jgi:HAMP domain-containing protein
MKYSLRSKYLVLLIVLVLGAVSISTWLHVQSTFEARREEMEARATALGQFVGLNFAEQFLKEDVDRSQARAIKFWVQEVDDARFIEIYSTDGEQLMSHGKGMSSIPELRNITPSFVRNIMSGGDDFLARRLSNRKVIDFLIPISLFDTQIGVVRLGLDASRYYQQRQEILMTNAQYGFSLLLVITLLGYAASPFLIQPIRNLISTAERFGKGEFDARSSVNSGDEIEELSNRFNEMAQHIEKLVQTLSDTGEFNRLFPYIIVPKKLYVKVVEHVRQGIGADYAGLVLKDENESMTKFINTPNGHSASKLLELDNSLFEEMAELTQENEVNPLVKRSQKANELSDFFDIDDSVQLADALVYPLGRNERFGYLVLGRENHDFPETEIHLCRNLVPQIETVTANARNFEAVLEDERTGLYPRKVMNLALNEAGEFASDQSLWFGRIGIESDGDATSKDDLHLETARFLNKSQEHFSPVQDPEHFFLVSHDESGQFLAMLSGWTMEEAHEIFEEIVTEISNDEANFPNTLASAGLIAVRAEESTKSLLGRSGEALKKAKNQGGARVCSES